MADLLAEVAVRVHSDFADGATVGEILTVVARCRNGPDTPAPLCPRWSSDWPASGSPSASTRRPAVDLSRLSTDSSANRLRGHLCVLTQRVG